jgi:hypothetical protein
MYRYFYARLMFCFFSTISCISFAMKDENDTELNVYGQEINQDINYIPLTKSINPVGRKKSPFSSAYAFGGILIGAGLAGAGATYFSDDIKDHQNAMYGAYFTSFFTGTIIYLITGCFDTCHKTGKKIYLHLKKSSEQQVIV